MLLYQEDAELLFPARVIPHLRHLRGDIFAALVERVAAAESENDPDLLGFSLMMIRLSSCLTCTADSYRAMNGCTTCAKKTIKGFKGTDAELVELFETARRDVMRWQAKRAANAGDAPSAVG